MLSFLVFDDHGRLPDDWPIRNAYLIGPDQNAMRSRAWFEAGALRVEKRDGGPAALALQHDLGELGEFTLQTCLLPEREAPYVLEVELARHRLMTLLSKLEDWVLFELPADHPVQRRADHARKCFIKSLCLLQTDPHEASLWGRRCLEAALDGSEELAVAHAATLLSRRHAPRATPGPASVGSGVNLEASDPRLRHALQANFDYVCLPTPWRDICPTEGEQSWDRLDSWVNWTRQANLPVVAGPILSFEPGQVPDWLYIWEHDYDTVRDFAYEHVETLVQRYPRGIAAWNVTSGLHVNEHLVLNFDQLMDLTRMVTLLVKKLQPSTTVQIELKRCFGEYYAHNQRSIPPLMYADLLAQSGIHYDELGLCVPLGQAVDGQYTRDLMQISALLDQFGQYGKPLSVSFAAPSETVTPVMIADPQSDDPVDALAGRWRREWSPPVQAHWLEAAMQVAMSKPFVTSVHWRHLVDHPAMDLPLSGLIDDEVHPKPAWRRLINLRRSLHGQATGSAPHPAAGAAFEPAPTS